MAGNLGANLGSVLVAIQLSIGDAALLAVASSGAMGSQKTHPVVLPCLDQSFGELVHHGFIVFRSGSDTQPLFAAFNCWVVDGLDVHAIFGQHLVGYGCALGGITNLRMNQREINPCRVLWLL